MNTDDTKITAGGVDDIDEADAAYTGDTESETSSLKSSILSYRYEHGRRYHAFEEGKYWAPNDEAQSDQLDTAHHIFYLLQDGKLFQAPIKDPQQVLDVGTGTGNWAVDFADQFPSTTVTGTDLSPIQPTWVPPNCKFEVEDCEMEWTFRKNYFDYIHVRALYGSLRDWPAFYAQAYAHLKPGAWFEQVEYGADWWSDDDSIPQGHIFEVVSASYVGAGEKQGKTFRILDLQKDYVEKAGFVNVVEKRYKMPLGPWPKDPKLKEVGRWHLLEVNQGLEGWSLALFTKVLGWSYEQVMDYMVKVREGLKDKSIHAYTRMSVVYGQKPES